MSGRRGRDNGGRGSWSLTTICPNKLGSVAIEGFTRGGLRPGIAAESAAGIAAEQPEMQLAKQFKDNR
jgi:hypothetical protein